MHMIAKSSGKFNYLLYTGNECKQVEEEFTHYGSGFRPRTTLRELAVPQLLNRVESGENSFIMLKVSVSSNKTLRNFRC